MNPKIGYPIVCSQPMWFQLSADANGLITEFYSNRDKNVHQLPESFKLSGSFT